MTPGIPYNFAQKHNCTRIEKLEDLPAGEHLVIIVEQQRSYSDDAYGQTNTYYYQERQIFLFGHEADWKDAALALYQEDANRKNVWAFKSTVPLRPTVTLVVE
jgi:hypothetical protein